MDRSNRRQAGYSCLRAGTLAGALSALLMFQAPAASGQADNAAAEVSAQWQSSELSFHYFGLTTYYTCTGLEDRLKHLLREMGAHPDVYVRATGCLGPDDISRSQLVRIRVRMPVAPAEAAADSFTASRRVVNFRTQSMSNQGSASCELLEQVRDQLLPKLNIELVKDDLHCVPGQPSHIGRSMQVQTLIASNGK